MKKTLTLLLSVALVLSMLSAGAAAGAADISGEWYGDLFGMAMTLTLDEDGSYSMEMAGEEPDTGTWNLDGESLIMDGDTENETVFAYDGESLFSDMGDGMEFLFTREPVAVFEPAAVRTDASLEELGGEWVCTLVSMMGMNLPPEMADIDMKLSIDGEVVTMSVAVMGEPATDELQAVFADGALTLEQPAEYEMGEDTLWVIQLLEDGTLSASSIMFEEPIAFYLEAVRAE
jgi:hypothetical protein